MLFAEYCLNEQYSIASTKRDASDNYTFRPRVCIPSGTPRILFRSHPRFVSSRYPREETSTVRGRWNCTMSPKRLRKMKFGNARGVCDKTRSSCFRSNKVFQPIFSEYKMSIGNCRIACAKNERREETEHVSEFVFISSGLLSSSRRPTLFATIKSQRTTLSRKREIYISILRVILDTRDPYEIQRRTFLINVKSEENLFFLHY